MRVREIAAGSVLALVLVLLLVSGVPSGHPCPTDLRSDVNPLATGPAVQTSTASIRNATTQTWVQTGATLYAGHATWRNWTFDVAAYSQLYSATLNFIIQPQSAYGAQVLVTQGATTLANRTTGQAISFTLSPTVGPTPVVEKITFVQALNGSVPAAGSYAVRTNVTSSIQFALFLPNAWAFFAATILYNDSQTISTSYGMWLNSTTLTFPFPSTNVVQVNTSTVLVTLNGTAANYQLSTGSLLLLAPNLAPGTFKEATVSWNPLAQPTGGPITVLLTSVPTTNGTYDYGVTWTNNNLTAYDGVYVLKATTFLGTMSKVTVYVDSRVLPGSAYSINGYNVTILPNVQSIYLGQSITFKLTFSAAGLPPISIANGQPVFVYGGVTFTLGDTWLLLLVLVLFYIVIAAAQTGSRGNYLGDILQQWKALGLLIGIAAVYVVGALA